MIAESIVETINSIISQVTAYVEKMHKPDPEAIFREVELELLCALANDLALHSDQLQDVVDKFELHEIQRKVGKGLLPPLSKGPLPDLLPPIRR
jgi:hypothetical protein